MIYIATALFCEASPLIKAFSLKKKNGGLKWDLYENDESTIRLIITGVGPVAATAAVSALFTQFGMAKEDCLINIGTCCENISGAGTGSLFLINKLTDGTTGRDYYPDMPDDSGLKENSITSLPVMVRKDENRQGLFDMEAAFIYQAARYYAGPAQIYFLKLVSDNGVVMGKNELITEKSGFLKELGRHTEQLMEGALESILSFIKKIAVYGEGVGAKRDYVQSVETSKAGNENGEAPEGSRGEEASVCCAKDDAGPDTEKEAFGQLYADLCATTAMERKLSQALKYAELAGTDYRKYIQELYDDGRIPVKHKREGILIMEELIRKIREGE